MAIKLEDKPAVSVITDNDTILIVKSTGEVRRITKADLTAIMNPLPTVTAADNGKVLAVVNGAWEAVAADWTGTQAEYDALGSYDNNTTYYIVEAAT